jgi:hypothetical protein
MGWNWHRRSSNGVAYMLPRKKNCDERVVLNHTNSVRNGIVPSIVSFSHTLPAWSKHWKRKTYCRMNDCYAPKTLIFFFFVSCFPACSSNKLLYQKGTWFCRITM